MWQVQIDKLYWLILLYLIRNITNVMTSNYSIHYISFYRQDGNKMSWYLQTISIINYSSSDAYKVQTIMFAYQGSIFCYIWYSKCWQDDHMNYNSARNDWVYLNIHPKSHTHNSIFNVMLIITNLSGMDKHKILGKFL